MTGGRAFAAPAVAVKPLEQRQLIVLLDPRQDPPSARDIASQDAAGSLRADLKQLFGATVGIGRVHSSIDDARESELRARSSRLAAEYLLTQYLVLTFDDTKDIEAELQRVKLDKRVLSVTPNYRLEFAAQPSDPLSLTAASTGAYQYGLHLLKFVSNTAGETTAWDLSRGRTHVAVIDNGIDNTHPDLIGNFRPQFSRGFDSFWYYPYENTTTDENKIENVETARGHGTHVAGIIAATRNNALGGAGGCPECSLQIYRVSTTIASVASTAIKRAVDHGASVINMSLSSRVSENRNCGSGVVGQDYVSHDIMCQSIAFARDRGVQIVAAAGNESQPQFGFPANSTNDALYGGIIPVGGVQANGLFWNNGYGNGPGTAPQETGSNYSSALKLVAPAKDVVSTFYRGSPNLSLWNQFARCGERWDTTFATNTLALPNGYGGCNGTSMATPHVSAIVGLMRSAWPLGNFWFTKANLENSAASYGTAVAGPGGNTFRIPNAYRAVDAALSAAGSRRVGNNARVPLFAFKNAEDQAYFYTTSPQMATAALVGTLPPRPQTGVRSPSDNAIYKVLKRVADGTPGTSNVLSYVSYYPNLPSANCLPANTNCNLGTGYDELCEVQRGPCYAFLPPRAEVEIWSTHNSPYSGVTLAPLYRLSKVHGSGATGSARHAYTTASNWATLYPGFSLDGIEGYIVPNTAAQQSGTVKLCRKFNPTSSDYVLFREGRFTGGGCTGPAGYTANVENTDFVGYAVPLVPYANRAVMFRLFRGDVGRHLYTYDDNEYVTLITNPGLYNLWQPESGRFGVHTSAAVVNGVSSMPMWRLYNSAAQQHMWTTDANEVYVLTQVYQSWVNETPVPPHVFPWNGSSCVAGTVPLYRMYYPAAPSFDRLYTTDANEYAVLPTRGWNPEGIMACVYPIEVPAFWLW